LGHSRHSPIRGIRDEKIRDFKKAMMTGYKVLDEFAQNGENKPIAKQRSHYAGLDRLCHFVSGILRCAVVYRRRDRPDDLVGATIIERHATHPHSICTDKHNENE
jgi:hypothetical protein